VIQKARGWVDALASANVDQAIFEREQLRCGLLGLDPTGLRKAGKGSAIWMKKNGAYTANSGANTRKLG
jgi:hypothetical protein